MTDESPTHDPALAASPEEMQEALFADLIARQTNLVLMFLGKLKDPKGSPPPLDLGAAQMFIDQLDMLQAKTRGNLTKKEEQFLKGSLTHLRMAFVEATERGPAATPPPAAPADPAAAPAPPPAGGAPAEDPAKVKFTKKY
jgi:hypothetical protein